MMTPKCHRFYSELGFIYLTLNTTVNNKNYCECCMVDPCNVFDCTAGASVSYSVH